MSEYAWPPLPLPLPLPPPPAVPPGEAAVLPEPAAEPYINWNWDIMGVPGIRFVPSDCELIVNYLRPKLRSEPLPTGNVQVADVYSDHPRNMVDGLDQYEGSWYVFSQRRRRYNKGMRPRRGTGDVGLWKAMGKSEDIRGVVIDENGNWSNQVIGNKRALTYHELDHGSEGQNPGGIKKKPQRKKTEWKMLEFVAVHTDRPHDSKEDAMLLNEWVLCKIMMGKVTAVKKKKNGTSSQLHEGEEEQQQATIAGYQEKHIQEAPHEEEALNTLSHMTEASVGLQVEQPPAASVLGGGDVAVAIPTPMQYFCGNSQGPAFVPCFEDGEHEAPHEEEALRAPSHMQVASDRPQEEQRAMASVLGGGDTVMATPKTMQNDDPCGFSTLGDIPHHLANDSHHLDDFFYNDNDEYNNVGWSH